MNGVLLRYTFKAETKLYIVDVKTPITHFVGAFSRFQSQRRWREGDETHEEQRDVVFLTELLPLNLCLTISLIVPIRTTKHWDMWKHWLRFRDKAFF